MRPRFLTEVEFEGLKIPRRQLRPGSTPGVRTTQKPDKT